MPILSRPMRRMFTSLLENFLQRLTYSYGELTRRTHSVESFEEVTATTLTTVALFSPIPASSAAVSSYAAAQLATHRFEELDFFFHICSLASVLYSP